MTNILNSTTSPNLIDFKFGQPKHYQNTSNAVCFTLFTPEAVQNTHGIILIIGYSIITLLVIISNTTLIVGLYKINTLFTVAQRLFILMSSMDLIIGLVFLPLQIYMIYTSERQGCGLIMIQAFVSMFFPYMSGLILLLVVVHRFFLVVNTRLTKKLAHRRNVRICLFISTLFAASMATWYAFQKRSDSLTAHGTYYLTAGLTVCNYVVIITFMNFKMVRFLHKASEKRIKRMSVSNSTKSRSTYHKRVAKTLALMSIVVSVCYTPMAVSFVVSGLFLLYRYPHMEVIQIIIPWSQMVMTLNSALNSFIYIVRTKKMLNLYKRVLKRFCCRVFGRENKVNRTVVMSFEMSTTARRNQRTESTNHGSDRF